jgi:hypothetical protein
MVLEVVNNGIQEPLEVRVGLTVVAVWCLGMVHPSHLFYNTYFTTVKDLVRGPETSPEASKKIMLPVLAW